MKKENGLTAVALVFFIGVIIVVVGIIINFSIGEEGVITKASHDEEEFNMTEVLDELNFSITEKYLGTYKNEAVNGKKIEEVYNKEIAIKYLKDSEIIENYNNKENIYFVKVDKLKGDIKQGKGQNGSDKDVYIIERSEKTDDYTVFYLKNSGEKVTIGNLEFEPQL